MKKIMILTSERTGNGHKSASKALDKKLKEYGYEVTQIDSFELMGRIGVLLENLYIPVTTKFPLVFYTLYLLSQINPNLLHFLVYLKCKNKLKKEIDNFKPELIISVHSMFTKSISYFLKKQKLNIPFYINVIDLVNPPKVWIDKNADVLFVPTKEVKEYYKSKGIDESKIFVSGFPIRDDIKRRTIPKTIEGKINILLVNPSVNLKKNIEYVKEVSKLDNADISVICGRDERMYNSLINEQKKGNISDNIKIYGFVNNMNEFLDKAHIILTKAGPNMILESAASGTAIVVTDNIKGQENNNYKYIEKNHFGFMCKDPKEIYYRLDKFIKTIEVNECLKNVLKVDCINGTEFITNYIKSEFN